MLSKALGDAERDGAVVKNVCKLQKAPRITESEMVIVQDVAGLVDKLRGERLHAPAMVALFTLEGTPLQPSNVSSDWGDLAERIGAPGVTFHGLRHTHASQLWCRIG